MRVALVAVRSELAACAIIINEARERQAWWRPDHDPLPAAKWDQHFAALSDPSLPGQLHAVIEHAYQRCDRLNQRIHRYLAEHRESVIFPLSVPKTVYRLRDDDEAQMRGCLLAIVDANTRISLHLGLNDAPNVVGAAASGKR